MWLFLLKKKNCVFVSNWNIIRFGFFFVLNVYLRKIQLMFLVENNFFAIFCHHELNTIFCIELQLCFGDQWSIFHALYVQPVQSDEQIKIQRHSDFPFRWIDAIVHQFRILICNGISSDKTKNQHKNYVRLNGWWDWLYRDSSVLVTISREKPMSSMQKEKKRPTRKFELMLV